MTNRYILIRLIIFHLLDYFQARLSTTIHIVPLTYHPAYLPHSVIIISIFVHSKLLPFTDVNETLFPFSEMGLFCCCCLFFKWRLMGGAGGLLIAPPYCLRVAGVGVKCESCDLREAGLT